MVPTYDTHNEEQLWMRSKLRIKNLRNQTDCYAGITARNIRLLKYLAKLLQVLK